LFGSAEGVHQNFENITKGRGVHQARFGRTRLSKSPLQRRGYEAYFQPERKSNIIFMTDNRTCEQVVELVAALLYPSFTLHYSRDSVNFCLFVSAAL
jgi:hypothetical protein